MNLKLYFKNPIKILIPLLTRFGGWLSDKLYLRIMYRAQIGNSLNLKNPKAFSEKIQWLKLYDRKDVYTQMVDKLAAKDYVARIIGSQYIIPTLGVWEKPEDIEWNILPDKFVLKTTNGGGSTGVVLCRGKSSFDYSNASAILHKSLKNDDIYRICKEWPYKNVKHQILAEKLLEDHDVHGLKDYKIFCCNGEPKMIKVNYDVTTNYYVNWYDVNWNRLNVSTTNDHANSLVEIEKPDKLDELLALSRALSKDMIFLRVDFYYVNNQIFFGELTFHPGSGFETFIPNRFDYELGSWINLPMTKNRSC